MIRRLYAPVVGLIAGALVGGTVLLLLEGQTLWGGEDGKRPLSALLENERNTVTIFEEASRSVVNIDPIGEGEGGAVGSADGGKGSGFIWDRAGHIVTNYHVVKDVPTVFVTTSNQNRAPATVIGVDPSKDIAVLRVDEPLSELKPIVLGDDFSLRVGQKVLAIGNPFGLDHTLSEGIVSALDRELETQYGRTIEGVIQTDAAINPGNSGGPLLDSSGEVVGMNTGIVSLSGGSAGVGFAVPISTVRRVVPDLIEVGRVKMVSLPLRFLPERVSRRMGRTGLIVSRVARGSDAERLGVQGTSRRRSGRAWIGDTLIAVDESPIENRNDLLNVLDRKNPGDTVMLRLQGATGVREIRLTLFGER